MYKLITSLYMPSLFTALTQIRETRQSTDVMAPSVPFAIKGCNMTSFAATGTITLNNLYAQLRTMNSLTSFKSELRKTFDRLEFQ